MDAAYFPRWGCAFCHDTHSNKETFNRHLDAHIAEVCTFKKTKLKPAGTHFVHLLRAVRRLSRRKRLNQDLRLNVTEFDACWKWRLYVVLETEEQLRAFRTRTLHTRAEWRELARSYIDTQAANVARRAARDNDDGEDDGDEDDSGSDSYIPSWPAAAAAAAAPAAPARALHQTIGSATSNGQVIMNGVDSPLRTGSVGQLNSAFVRGEQNTVNKAAAAPVVTPERKIFTRQPLFTTPVYGAAKNSSEAGPSRAAQRTVIDLTVTPSKRGFDIWTPVKTVKTEEAEKPKKPAALDKGKAKAAPSTSVIVKGLGQFEVSAFAPLKELVAMIKQRVAEVMGPDAGDVAGLVVQGGTLTEEMWSQRVGKMVVAIAWAWSE